MKTTIIFFVVSCLTLCSCSVSQTTNERRVAELPKGVPDATLATAEKICRDLIARGYGADIQRKFPSLTQQQLQGLYLNWNEGVFSQGGKSVFITCGLNYTGSLPEAKEVGDYCESVVKKAVADRFARAVK
jgi:hypothetical protein